jgi:DNA-binding LacI/PurR family transcriptional regulator
MKNIETLYLRGVDGLIIAPTIAEYDYLKNILPPDFPLVFVDRQPEYRPLDCVLLDNAEAGYTATRHLIGQGNGKIGFISFHYGRGGIDNTIAERLDGYKQALAEAKIEADPRYIKVIPGSPSTVSELRHAETYSAMKQMIDSSVQAVLCGNGLAAIGAYTCLKDLAVKIPEEMRIITFDDDLWLSMVTPQISAIAQPGESMGIAAATRLLERIHGEDSPREFLRLRAEMILRESC